MPTGSGLDAQIGFGQETTWGTEATVTRFVEFNSETMQYNPTFLEPGGLRVGTKFKRVSRTRVARTDVTGDVTVDFATLGMGMLVRNCLGSATASTATIVSPATKQVHQPGGYMGMGLTCQVGRPQPSGTVQSFTYSGCKVTKWEFDVKDNAIPTLKLTLDGKAEDTTTALTTAAYLSGTTVFDFSETTIKLGGTATTTSGVVSISGGVAATTVITEFDITGTTPLDTSRFGLGNQGLKSEQLENNIPTITGKLTAEFNETEWYSVFKANTKIPLQFTLVGGAIGASGSNNTFDIIMPAVLVKAAPPQVSGPGVVSMSISFEVYSDEVNAPIQATIISADTTV